MNKKNYIQSINKYNKEKMKLYSVRFHKENQRDIIEHLDNQPNKAGYIARLIREDMERNGIDTLKKITLADIVDKFNDNDKVVLVFPDESMLMSCKANLTSMLNKEVKSYEKKDDAWHVEVRYA